MGKIKVNEIEKHDATEVTVNSNVVMAAGTSVSSPSISTDTISEKTSAAGVTIDGVLIKDSKIGGTITIPGSTGTMALTSDISAGGLEEVDVWHLTTDFTGDANPISSNLSRWASGWEKIGTGMTESSGVFTFPSTGKWNIEFNVAYTTHPAYNAERNVLNHISYSNDGGSTWDVYQAKANANMYSTATAIDASAYAQLKLDVTNTSNDKVRFRIDTQASGTKTVAAGATELATYMTFSKLGDT